MKKNIHIQALLRAICNHSGLCKYLFVLFALVLFSFSVNAQNKIAPTAPATTTTIKNIEKKQTQQKADLIPRKERVVLQKQELQKQTKEKNAVIEKAKLPEKEGKTINNEKKKQKNIEKINVSDNSKQKGEKPKAKRASGKAPRGKIKK
jgi:TolA-binding protein